jgi:hypothetical protein
MGCSKCGLITELRSFFARSGPAYRNGSAGRVFVGGRKRNTLSPTSHTPRRRYFFRGSVSEYFNPNTFRSLGSS